MLTYTNFLDKSANTIFFHLDLGVKQPMIQLVPQAIRVKNHSAGYTLLELVIAMSITATLIAISFPRYTTRGSKLELYTFTDSVVATLKNSRDIAIRSRTRNLVTFTTRKHFDPDQKNHIRILVPTGIAFIISESEGCVQSGSEFTVHHEPDGTSCNATLSISNKEFRRQINVIKATGGTYIENS